MVSKDAGVSSDDQPNMDDDSTLTKIPLTNDLNNDITTIPVNDVPDKNDRAVIEVESKPSMSPKTHSNWDWKCYIQLRNRSG